MEMRIDNRIKRRKQIRVKSKIRFTCFVAMIIIMAVIGFNSILGLNVVSGESNDNFITVEVLPGETLWDIASNNMSDDMDKRKAVYLIQKANDLDDADIHPGQILKVPVS
jgi:hypothetical protein